MPQVDLHVFRAPVTLWVGRERPPQDLEIYGSVASEDGGNRLDAPAEPVLRAHVALDVDGKLAVGEEPIYIQATRTVVRFQELYPSHSVGAMYRYVELRGMGLQFMKKQGFIESFEYHKTGLSGFEGFFEVMVADPNLVAELITELRAEQNRRWPGQKVEADVKERGRQADIAGRLVPQRRSAPSRTTSGQGAGTGRGRVRRAVRVRRTA